MCACVKHLAYKRKSYIYEFLGLLLWLAFPFFNCSIMAVMKYILYKQVDLVILRLIEVIFKIKFFYWDLFQYDIKNVLVIGFCKSELGIRFECYVLLWKIRVYE